MADLIQRQRNFLNYVSSVSLRMETQDYADLLTLTESFNEEFFAGQSNSLDPTDGKADNLEAEFGFAYADVAAFINQTGAQYLKLWTNAAVTAGDYGKFARAVMSNRTL